MPSNCSADVQAVLAHIDDVFATNDTDSIAELKDMFGMADVTHADDFAGKLVSTNMYISNHCFAGACKLFYSDPPVISAALILTIG